MRMRSVFCSIPVVMSLLFCGYVKAGDAATTTKRHVGEYYINNGYIYGPKLSGKFYILNRYIYGPKNNGKYYIQLGYDPAKIGPFYIWGPKKGGLYYIQNNYIFGPPGELPWMEEQEPNQDSK